MVQGGDDGVLAFYCVDESAGVGIVDCADVDVAGEDGFGRIVAAGEGRDLESVGVEERFDDGAAGIAGCLSGIVRECVAGLELCAWKREDLLQRWQRF